jgi:hypothetical protein
MDTKYKLFITVALISVTMIYSRCKPSICSDAIAYSFQVNNAKAYPDKDSIKTGDTLWIEINFPTKLQDVVTGNTIDYGNAVNLGEDLSLLIFTGGSVSDPGASYANTNFDYFIANGGAGLTSINGVRNFLFSELNGSYLLKVGIIPKKAGIYGLGIGNPTGVYRKNDACTKASFAISFYNTNQHLYYYQNNRPGYSISDYEQQHMYCFKVY